MTFKFGSIGPISVVFDRPVGAQLAALPLQRQKCIRDVLLAIQTQGIAALYNELAPGLREIARCGQIISFSVRPSDIVVTMIRPAVLAAPRIRPPSSP